MRLNTLLFPLLFLVACPGSFSRGASSTAAPTLSPARSAITASQATSTVTARATLTPAPLADPTLDPTLRRFPESGHSIGGAFRTFWEERGGLPIFGLPLTEAVVIDGVPVQYFERARFELRDGAVRLGHVGSEALLDSGQPVSPAIPVEGCQFFPETRHNLCQPLLDFWRHSGGLPILGYPIHDAERNGETLVQYFERARVEAHDGGSLVLGRVGAEALDGMPGGEVLRTPDLGPATEQAVVIGQSMAALPFEQARIRLLVEGYSGPAEVLIADRRGQTSRHAVSVVDGSVDVTVEAKGALGPQAAIVLIGGRVAGVGGSAMIVRAETTIRTGQPRFDELYPIVKGFMDQDTSQYVFDGHLVHGYRSPDSDLLWLRDHVHQAKGFAYWERDMLSLLDQFRRFQYPDGSFDDYIANKHWGVVRGRVEVEADLEYLFIEGVYRAWQATGDDDWLRQQVAAMEQGLHYIRTSPLRWDSQFHLVKRPFTVDTWDFEYGPPTFAPNGNRAPRHWIDEQTKWSIFHGDNTGYAHSMELLARMYEHLGDADRARYWRGEAAGITERLNQLAWNGTFFTHMYHLTPVEVPGVDEAQQLSLSNAYALNRSGMTEEQARRILDEYHRRYAARGASFSEWYSIDPPFPANSLSTGPGWGQNPGEYVNGGHMPLVGGELAQGAFRYGVESYGFDILQRYYGLVAATGSSYLWYYPAGNPGKSGSDTLPTDGWGSSAMLAALIEGAAGVQDNAKLFEQATIAPRWTATQDVQDADVIVRYGASEGYIAYQWKRRPNGLELRWTGSGSEVRLRMLLPPDVPEAIRATLDGQAVDGSVVRVGNSDYFELDAQGSGALAIDW